MDSVFFPSPFLLSSYSLMLVSLIYPYFSRSRWRWPTVHHIWKTWINIHAHTCIGGTTTIYLYCESFRTNRDEESTGVHRDYVTFSRSYFFCRSSIFNYNKIFCVFISLTPLVDEINSCIRTFTCTMTICIYLLFYSPYLFLLNRTIFWTHKWWYIRFRTLNWTEKIK